MRNIFPVSLCLVSSLAAPLQAAPLFSEPFNSEATAKVTVKKLANASVSYVNYSSFVREETGGGGPVTVQIPEAPSRLAGSAATRGVVLNATYAGTARLINLLAATAAPADGGTAAVFTGNYRMSCDMWLSVDNTTTTGTTEIGLFGIGHSGAGLVGYSTRGDAVGTYGWLAPDAGIAATTGDVTLFSGTTNAFRKDAADDLFDLAFPTGGAVLNSPNNQWTRIELAVVGTKATLFLNGVKFGESDPANTDGFAVLGYEDFSTGSISGGRNLQFGLFDNFVVESIDGAPELEASPLVTFAPVTAAGDISVGSFNVTNLGSEERSITSASIDGANAADFELPMTFPVVISAGAAAAVEVNFNSSTPNGLKVARLVLNTTDPNLPVIYLPLQARRTISSIEAAINERIGSVSVTGGTGTGFLTVTNNSANTVTLSAPTLSGADAAMFSVTGTFPTDVAAQDSISLPIVFTPTGAAGLKTATLEIPTSDPDVAVLSTLLRSRYGFGAPLLAHFKLDEASGSLVDSVGGPSAGVTATLGYAQPSLLPGGAGTAVRFNSLNNNSFAFSQTVHLPNVSYALWIKPEAKDSGTNRTLLHRASAYTTASGIYALYLDSLGRLILQINGTTVVETLDGTIVDGTVYHVGFTHSDLDGFGNVTATRTRLYVNGEVVAESAPVDPELAVGFTDYNLSAPGIGLYLGHTNGGGDTGYVGAMDDLQIYSYELTPEEMGGLFTQPGKTVSELETVVLDYRITNVVYDPSEATVSLTWNSAPGAIYSVQESETTSGFTDVTGATGIPSGGLTTSKVITGASGPRKFYIIRRTSP